MIEVLGWVFTNITVMEVGVKLYDLNSNTLYNWQLTTTNNTYTVTTAEQFFYAPWFSLTGIPAGTYDAAFGMFDENGKIIYELLFSLVL